ncbi:MAG TPA: oligosaccharide flippase family protein, partial [Candidatus Polarisedimenticolia bacterium]|nr:oligosaccharide flippase family protein [Candidatus Polarisedimenticolia bacterium]
MTLSSNPREIARDFAYVTLSRGISLAISFVRSLVIPGLLGPMAYGVWKTLGLIQTYAQFGDFGARAALRREIPFHAGRNDSLRLALVRDVSFGANNLSILLAAAGTLVACALVDDPMLRTAMLLFLPLLYVSHMFSFMEQVLAGLKQFAFMSRLTIGSGLLEAVLAIGMTWAIGLNGLILGTFLSYLVVTFVQMSRVGFDLRPRFRWSVFKELVSIGFPSHLNGLLYNIFLSIDRWLILSFLGLTSMGYYALGMTINEYLFLFSYTFGNVLSPRLVETYSRRESIEDLRGMVEVPLVI